jgi:cobyrinic acid a,c-diamide synthase
MARLFLSATHKSSGKTTIALGLAATLRRRGLDVRTFKKGPDYIDPMWLSRASARPCYNLDFHTQTKREILATLASRSRGGDIALIEGNKGLHDGVDLEGRDSSAALARLTRAPVVLVVDALGMTRGVAPLLLGYAKFDRKVSIAGVILNRVGPDRQVAKLRQALERYTDIPVLGAVGRDEELAVRERHLGLATPAETSQAEAIVAAAATAVTRSVDVDRLLEIARRAPALDVPAAKEPPRRRPDLRIAVARDAAFGFYYADDLEALERGGAELVFFDALRDAHLPPCDGLFIGGGFPETQAERLEQNASLRAEIRAAIAGGLPAYAECGGLMYLSRSIVWKGERHEMVGAVPADARMHAKPQGRGLVALEASDAFPWRGAKRRGRIPAHEFHYAALEGLPDETAFAYRVRRGFGVDGRHDGVRVGSLLASFSHMRDTSRNRWTGRFLDFVREARKAAPDASFRTSGERPTVAVPRMGEVYLVGAGPGDPELLTLRALRLMRRADVVLYDRLADAAVMDLVPDGVERIYVGKRPNAHALSQPEICALMARLAREGKRVLRLKGGDPFMFGRGGEEIEALADQAIPFEVCPGVTAAAGASAYAGIPLTHRDHAQACVFVTGHGKDGRVDLDWRSLVQPNQTVAIYMGLANLEELTAELIVRGARADMPAAVIDNATRPSQCVVAGTLATLAAKARSANLTGPAIVIVGSVVSLRQKLAAESEAAPQSERDPERAVAERATAPGEPTASLEIVEAW